MARTPRCPLFIFEMANNHGGDVSHGSRILREFAKVGREHPFQFAFKFQYRDLATIVHPDYRERTDLKYIKRFSETRLSDAEFRRLKDEAAALGFVTICTPFDERSVDQIEEHGYDIVKIASCSITDWPLLERIAKTQKPIIASTAGASLEDIDKVVAFFEHREKDFSIMHCVAEYPTCEEHLDLNQIQLLRERYRPAPVGYSTHEDPDTVDSVKVAVGMGATIFEKHVGVPTDRAPLNAYSATPQQAQRWIDAAAKAVRMCGVAGQRRSFDRAEIASLQSLARGAFAKRAISAGQRISPSDVFLAIPNGENQLSAGSLSKYTVFYATEPVPAKAALTQANTRRVELREKVNSIVNRVKELIRVSGVVVPTKVDMEISHHYGLERFDEFGLTMLTVVNRGYCKKILILLPGQTHPEQHHLTKEEAFHVLYGKLWVNLDDHVQQCAMGDLVVIEPGVRHSFGTDSGAILEEISLTHHAEDSFYTDPAIQANAFRKTLLTHWME